MKNHRLFLRLYGIVIFLIYAIPQSLLSQGKDDFRLFGDDKELLVTLRFDLTYYIREKPSEEYLDAEMVFHFSQDDSLVNKIRVRSRGNSRNEFCALPPIRLNFKDCDNRPVDLDKENNVKLVTHCFDNNKFDDFIIKEYLAYRLYNIVSDSSFRVRLLRINYIDTGKRGLKISRLGFLIEPVTLLAERMRAVEREGIVVREEYVDSDLYDKLCLFQYMTGNDDWYLPNLHNLKLFEPADGDKSILSVVPYDFDYSGLVNAYYAIPNERYEMESIVDRIYLGPCRSDETFRRLMGYFLERREEFLRIIDEMDYLSDSQKKKTLHYIESFYALYKKDRLLLQIKKGCRK